MENKELKRRVSIMFTALRGKGFFARQNLLFGDTDGWSVVPDCCENVVFYNGQSYDSTFKYGYDSVLWLAWGWDVQKIIVAATKAGLETEWEWLEDRKVCVFLPGNKPSASI